MGFIHKSPGMNNFGVVLLLFVPAVINCDTTSLVSAISQIANHVFVNNSNGFDISVFGDDTLELESVANKLGKFIKIPHLHFQNKISSTIRSGIFLYKSWEDYRKHVNNVLLEGYRLDDLYYLTVIEEKMNKTFLDKKIDTLSSLARYCKDYHIYIGAPSIILSTFDKYRTSNCPKVYQLQVNEFLISSRKWKHNKFSVKKFSNLNQCKMNINLTTCSQNFTSHAKKSVLLGYVTKFNDIISRKMNFSFSSEDLKVVETSIESLYRFIHRSDDSGSMLYRATTLRELLLQQDGRFPLYSMTKGYKKIDKIILISRFKTYTSFERFFLIIQANVWFCLIGSLVIVAVFLAIFLVFARSEVEETDFGAKLMNFMQVNVC